MAITGKFDVDFSSFSAAVDAADVKLKTFDDDSKKVEASLSKMSNALSGQKMIQEATLMAEAVERIGGTSKLTEAELARLGTQAADAVDKMQRLGLDVPAKMQALADATKATADQTSAWSGALSTATGYLSAFGINATLSGIVSFTASVFESASAIHDMGERLGISAEAVQGFKFAAEQAGSSLDAVGSAITKMNKNLAEGNQSTVGALKEAGLSFEAIRSMKPEDAFLTITDAIAKMPDPMERSDVTLKLFGKSAAELLPAITEGFRAAADGAQKMSNDTVNALERAEDAWTKLRNSVVIATGSIIADTIDATTHITSSWGNFFQFLTDAGTSGFGAATALATMNERLKDTYEVVGPVQQGVHQTKEETDAAAAAFKKWEQAMVELDSAGQGWQGTLNTIDGTVVEAIKYYLDAGVSQQALATAFGLTDVQVKAVDQSMKAYAETLKAVQKIEGDHVKEAETNYLGLSKAENDFTQKRFENAGKAATEIEKINAQLTDDYNKQTMSRAAYEDAKIWETAQKQIDAFTKTGATAAQVTDFSNKIWEEAAIKASEVDWTSSQTITDITKQAIDGVQKMAAAGAAAIQSLQGGVKLPGSSTETAFGQNYLTAPNGAKVPLGPGGTLPDNWMDLYSGKSSFSSGISNLPRFAGGVTDFAGGLAIVGERGPELVHLPGGSDVIPNLGGGSGKVSITIQVTQPFGTPEAIARAVADAQVALMRNQGIRLPYGT
jgi:hypothetical protein